MPEYSNLFVVLMGLGTVFAGLLCIILLVTLMSWVCARTSAPKTVPQMPALRTGGSPSSSYAYVDCSQSSVINITPLQVAV